MIRNLNQLKKAMSANPRFEIVGHCRKECIGQVRRVTLANTVGLYSLPQELTDKESQQLNNGKGFFLCWKKPPNGALRMVFAPFMKKTQRIRMTI